MYHYDAAADACLVLARAMMELSHKAAPEHGPLHAFERSRAALEADLLDLARTARFDMSLPAAFLHCRSEAFLSLLPDRKKTRLLAYGDMHNALPWITASHLRLAIQKGYHPARSATDLIDHRPDDREWDALIEGPYSEAGVAMENLNGQRSVALSGDLARIKNAPRLARFLKAQVKHHPEEMRGALRAAFRNQSASCVTPILLIAAGVPVDFEMTPHESFKGIYDLAKSNHGRMQLLERHGGIEGCLSLMRANEKARKRGQALYEM